MHKQVCKYCISNLLNAVVLQITQLQGLDEQQNGRSGQLGSFRLQNLDFVGLFGSLALAVSVLQC